MSDLEDQEVEVSSGHSMQEPEEAEKQSLESKVQMNQNLDFEVIWHNLSYSVIKKSLFGKTLSSRPILKSMSGRCKSGELVALMGPSGAGKSTLLECIIGRRANGRSGDAFFRGNNDESKIKLAFIPQHDLLIQTLTVRECITFASKLQNSTQQTNGTLEPVEDENGKIHTVHDADYRRALVDSIIKKLNLNVCENNRVSGCSGGQKKRLSIAQELVAKPTILILDEPTSGLDSASCLQVVELLKQLTQGPEPVLVLVTIHQPSVKTLNLFHRVYMLTNFGKCLYEGPPEYIPEAFAVHGLEIPKLHNPADFAIEAASGEHGFQAIDAMVKTHDKDFIAGYLDVVTSDIPLRPLLELRSLEKPFPFMQHIWYHTQRSLLMTIRDPLVFAMRFSLSFIVAIFIGILFGQVGKRGGCPPNIDGDFVPADLDVATKHIKDELEETFNNTGQQFFSLLFMLYNALLPTCLSFPYEMHVFIKERNNGWYSTAAFFLGKVAAEAPFQILLPPIYVAIIWMITAQVPVLWRYLNYTAMMIVISFIGQSIGYIIGATFMEQLQASVFLATISCVPFMLISGIFVKVSAMPDSIRWLCSLSYIRFGVEGLLITLYGFNRCGEGASQKLLEAKDALIVWLGAMLGTFDEATTAGAGNASLDYAPEGKPTIAFVENLVDALAGKFMSGKIVQSSVLTYLDLFDDHMVRSWAGLLILLVIKRVIAYKVIAWKANSNK